MQEGIITSKTNWSEALYIGGRTDHWATKVEMMQYNKAVSDMMKIAKGDALRGIDESLSHLEKQVAVMNDNNMAAARAAAYYWGPGFGGAAPNKTSQVDAALCPTNSHDQELDPGMGELVRRFGKSIPVQLNMPVAKISWGGDPVVAETASGEKFTARKILVTVPLGILQASLGDNDLEAGNQVPKDVAKILFDPPLPQEKVQAIKELVMGTWDKIILQFNGDPFGPKWPQDTMVHYVAEQDSMQFLLKLHGGNMVIGIVGGKSAYDLENKDDSTIAEYALSRLEKMFGPDVRKMYQRVYYTRWGQNKYSNGGYSSALPGHAAAHDVLGQPVENRLFFGGEATSKHWVGTVSGAYNSGLRNAKLINEALKKEYHAAFEQHLKNE